MLIVFFDIDGVIMEDCVLQEVTVNRHLEKGSLNFTEKGKRKATLPSCLIGNLFGVCPRCEEENEPSETNNERRPTAEIQK